MAEYGKTGAGAGAASEPEGGPCITQVAATIPALLGLDTLSSGLGQNAAGPLSPVLAGAEAAFGGAPCDRVFMYNPDAIAWWIYQKYRSWFAPLEAGTSLKMRSVVPPKTPVCFASMYSGLQPENHGIRRYEKPVLTVPTVFDVLPEASMRVAIVSTAGDSISLIFLNRNITYFIFRTKEECNRKALELIRNDEYDMIVLYNGDYDYWMHRVTPTGFMARRALKQNIQTYCTVRDAIAEHWKSHRTALAFAPDHGCHAQFGFPPGDHGDDRLCDMTVPHWWTFL